MTETPALPVIQAMEVRLGDTIRMSYTAEGITTSRTGKVGIIREKPLALRSAEDGPIWGGNWGFDAVIELLDRPQHQLPGGIGAVVEFEAGGKSWRLVHTDAQNWTLLREFKSGYAFNTWVNNEGAAERIAEAIEVRIITEGVVL